MSRTQVICPDCGSIGANNGPCRCHKCEHKVMMLPSTNGEINGNWLEYFGRPSTRVPMPKHPYIEDYVGGRV